MLSLEEEQKKTKYVIFDIQTDLSRDPLESSLDCFSYLNNQLYTL